MSLAAGHVRIAHLSDPHFGTVYPHVERALLDCLRSLAPHVVVFTGDITQRARRNQFHAARAFVEAISPVPVLAVPGNHDIPLFNAFARLFFPYGGFRRHFQPRTETGWSEGGVEIFALNSTKPWRYVQGGLSPARIRSRIPKEKSPKNLRIAAFHHPMDCASTRDEVNLLRGGQEALAAFRELGVDLVLGGHIHDPHVTLSDSRYPAEGTPLVLATAGTCLSWRIRLNAPNSFHWIEALPGDQPSLKITRFELDRSHQFKPGLEKSFLRGGSGWDYDHRIEESA